MISTLNNLRKAQISAYREFPLMRLIYGRQFTMIYNALKEKEKFKDKLSSFLMFLKCNLIENELNYFSNHHL